MPRTQANLRVLRERFSEILGNQKDSFTGRGIPPLLARLGLDDCPDAPSKREHLSGGVLISGDEQIVPAIQEALKILALPLNERDELQELVWDDDSHPVVPARYRREVALGLANIDLFLDWNGFHEVLGALWRVDEGKLLADFSFGPTLRDQIEQHHIRHDDWDVVTVFDKLGAFSCTDCWR